MIWTAWNNGGWHTSGAGYGFKVQAPDRDRWFSPERPVVVVVLPSRTGPLAVTVNIDKASFWGATCRELISRDIGQWLISEGHAPWPQGYPPKIEVRRTGPATFEVTGVPPTRR
jgi:hypothetical protein